MRILLVLALLLVPAMLFAQVSGEEEPTTEDEAITDSGHLVQVSFKNRPSLRIGEFAQVDLKAKWHLDFRRFSPPVVNLPGIVNALPATPDTFFLNKARFGLKGHVTKYIDYEVERDMRKTFGRGANGASCCTPAFSRRPVWNTRSESFVTTEKAQVSMVFPRVAEPTPRG